MRNKRRKEDGGLFGRHYYWGDARLGLDSPEPRLLRAP